MGIRKEWTNNNGLTVGIDICQFSTEQDAKKGGENMSRNTYLFDRIVSLDELNFLTSIINEWQEKWNYGILKNSFSVIGIKGKKVVHVYNYNEKGIDVNFIQALFEQLSKTL